MNLQNIDIEENKNIEFLSPASECFMADEYFELATPEHFWIQWRFAMLRKMLLKNFSWGNTLDIGCGNGVTALQIKKYYGCVISGCDLNLTALRMSPCDCGQLYFYNVHQRRKEFKEYFSTIILLDILEHIKDPIAFLDSVNFHLKPGGKLIINVPAFPIFYSEYDKAQGHFKRYTSPILKKELELSGFYIERMTYWGKTLTLLLLLRKCVMRFCKGGDAIKAGFKPPSVTANSILHFLRRVECRFFLSSPLGTSLMAIARK